MTPQDKRRVESGRPVGTAADPGRADGDPAESGRVEGHGLIIRGVGGQYWIDDGRGGEPRAAKPLGIFRKTGTTPLAGDRVTCVETGDPLIPLTVTAIHERRNALIRPAVANLDCLIVTFALQDPVPDLYLIDKLLIVCAEHRIDPILVLTKTDQLDAAGETAAEALLAPYRAAGFTVLRTGFGRLDGREALLRRIAGRIVAFAGQSGVGKSTLLNDLFGSELMETGEISGRAGRGRHTTRHVELFPFAGGYIADTPGFSSLELETLGVGAAAVVAAYPEIAAAEGRCRFVGCRHIGEAGCAVDPAAVDAGRLERYRYFRNLIDAIKPYAARRPDRRPSQTSQSSQSSQLSQFNQSNQSNQP